MVEVLKMKSIQQLRKEAELSQKDLADKLGVDHSYISKIEHGVKPLNDCVLQMKLCQALGVPLKEIAPEKCVDRRFPVAVHGSVVYSMREYYDAVRKNSHHCKKDFEQMINDSLKMFAEASYLAYLYHLSAEDQRACEQALGTGKGKDKWTKDLHNFRQCSLENWQKVGPRMLAAYEKYKNSLPTSESDQIEHVK